MGEFQCNYWIFKITWILFTFLQIIYALSVYNKKERNNAITVSGLCSQFLKFLMKIISSSICLGNKQKQDLCLNTTFLTFCTSLACWICCGIWIICRKCWSSCAVFLFQLAAFNIQEALIWKEKIESVIDQVSILQNV